MVRLFMVEKRTNGDPITGVSDNSRNWQMWKGVIASGEVGTPNNTLKIRTESSCQYIQRSTGNHLMLAHNIVIHRTEETATNRPAGHGHQKSADLPCTATPGKYQQNPPHAPTQRKIPSMAVTIFPNVLQ